MIFYFHPVGIAHREEYLRARAKLSATQWEVEQTKLYKGRKNEVPQIMETQGLVTKTMDRNKNLAPPLTNRTALVCLDFLFCKVRHEVSPFGW